MTKKQSLSVRQEIVDREREEDAASYYFEPMKLEAAIHEIIETFESYVASCAVKFPLGSLGFDHYSDFQDWRTRCYTAMAPEFEVLEKRYDEYRDP